MSDAPKDVETPSRIGRYEVERLLGQGGMGRVWLARDTVLGRRVAIKVLRDDLALPPRVRSELLQRMRHEARAAAAVSHPNIVTLHDMGEDDEVGLYLVFEYVPGPERDEPESLRDRLRQGGMPLPEVARLARELGAALSFAHEAGVIHRDVKPENVLFSRTGAKIADFGIARIPESTITRANTVLGTPAYTAPEALSHGDFSPASDQFSLAATLYEAITGARAFAGADPLATAGKVSSEPPPPIHPSLGAPPVVRSLDAAVQKGLSKVPRERFDSCQELGESVARAIDLPPPESLPSVDDLLALERTPLSSRMALAEKVARLSDRPKPPGETPVRPSVLIRKRTHRFQNIVAAVSLLVILALLILGRKQGDGAAASDADAASPSASASASTPTPRTAPPRPSASPRRPASTPAPAASTGTEDAAAPAPDAPGSE